MGSNSSFCDCKKRELGKDTSMAHLSSANAHDAENPQNRNSFPFDSANILNQDSKEQSQRHTSIKVDSNVSVKNNHDTEQEATLRNRRSSNPLSRNQAEEYDSKNTVNSKLQQMRNLTGKTIEFMGDKIDGFGVQVWDNQAKYIGKYIDGKASGYGKFFAGVDSYQGEFKEDVAYGYGIYKHGEETTYEGLWENDSQEECGIEEWQDGSLYKGQYKDGKKHGLGTYYWSDGGKYEGEWSDNSLDGYGIYFFANQRIYLGQWKNNMKHGYGEFIWKEKKYIGYYRNDKKDGFGVYYFKNVNKAFIGFWKKGKQYGFGKFMTSNKNKYGLWGDNNAITWFKNESEADQYLEDNKLDAFKELLHSTLDDIRTFCLNNEQGDRLLEEFTPIN